ncbi:hypothetical protein ELQ35_20575 [Peribacillus cavernae]|uniref:LXG domain-containing protein n=1 Tax=Peribacillus cavernae TaxID=1674310 RepID=A0A3S0V7L7_9BACI|nr:uncharacterized protein YcfJ [Peribacillus cavernae]RUQ25176.1 hypothetical protein ELQ35_20575 [Peribacillus cavernae]
MNKDRTVEQLHQFDSQQTNRLDSFSESIQIMADYVKELETMFHSKDLSINGYHSGLLMKKLANGDISGLEMSSREKAAQLLTDFENNKELERMDKSNDSAEFLSALKDGAIGASLPLAIMMASQKSGLLRIEYTRKKNHYAFTYNRKLLKFLKGDIGPTLTRRLIKGLNQKGKGHAFITKTLKVQNKNIEKLKNFKDNRSTLQKMEGMALKVVTGNRPIHETVKSKIFKNSARDMLIDKKTFKKLASKTSAGAAVAVGAVSALYNIGSGFNQNNDKYNGKRLYEQNGRVVGEEVNKLVGSVSGAAVGTYIGAAIGGVVSGPFAPFGAAAGAVIGGAIGSSVGEWSSKYTNKWMSDAGAATGKALHNTKEQAQNALKDAKESLDGFKDKLLGWS